MILYAIPGGTSSNSVGLTVFLTIIITLFILAATLILLQQNNVIAVRFGRKIEKRPAEKSKKAGVSAAKAPANRSSALPKTPAKTTARKKNPKAPK